MSEHKNKIIFTIVLEEMPEKNTLKVGVNSAPNLDKNALEFIANIYLNIEEIMKKHILEVASDYCITFLDNPIEELNKCIAKLDDKPSKERLQ